MVSSTVVALFLVIETGFSFAPNHFFPRSTCINRVQSFTVLSAVDALVPADKSDTNPLSSILPSNLRTDSSDPSRVLVKASVRKRLGSGSRRRFAELMATLRQRGGLDSEAARLRVKSFEVFDTNNDGVVDLGELKQGLFDKFGVECTDEECEIAASKFDDNQNGILEVEEFKLGLIKRDIELAQGAKSAEAAAAKVASKKGKDVPFFSKLRDWMGDNKNDKDNDSNGGGPGGGLGSLARSPVLVPVPVRVRGEFDF